MMARPWHPRLACWQFAVAEWGVVVQLPQAVCDTVGIGRRAWHGPHITPLQRMHTRRQRGRAQH